MFVRARRDVCPRLFLGSIKTPVPSSRPDILLAAVPGRVKSAVFGGNRAPRSSHLGASMARTHDLARPGPAATLGSRLRGGVVSPRPTQLWAPPPRCCPERGRGDC